MITRQVTVGTEKANLKTLLEIEGVVFPNDNDTCIGVVVQIDPAATGVVQILSGDATEGLKLEALGEAGAKSHTYPDFRVGNTSLISDTADTLVNVQVLQIGG